MNYKEIVISAVVLLLVVAGGVFLGTRANESKTLGSVVAGNEYSATSTVPASASTIQLCTRGGVLAQVDIQGALAGAIYFFNATTSDITQRTATVGSSTILTIAIPVSAVARTATFDAVFPTGLIMNLPNSPTTPTTTVMYRCY